MTKPLNTRDRLHEIKRWLDVAFPPPFPVRLRVERMSKEDQGKDPLPPQGIFWQWSNRGLIRVRKNMTRTASVETMLHEWAHARTIKHPALEKYREDEHEDDFWLELGRIERARWRRWPE